jgi:hypothetical protein
MSLIVAARDFRHQLFFNFLKEKMITNKVPGFRKADNTLEDNLTLKVCLGFLTIISSYILNGFDCVC